MIVESNFKYDVQQILLHEYPVYLNPWVRFPCLFNCRSLCLYFLISFVSIQKDLSLKNMGLPRPNKAKYILRSVLLLGLENIDPLEIIPKYELSSLWVITTSNMVIPSFQASLKKDKLALFLLFHFHLK